MCAKPSEALAIQLFVAVKQTEHYKFKKHQ